MRIWLGCLGGALVSAGGMWWVIGVQAQPGGLEAPALVAWLAGVALLGVVVGAVLATWLSHRLVTHLEGLNAGLETGQIAELRGLPAVSGWGEVSTLTQRIQQLITQHRHAVRASEDLGVVRQRVALLRESLVLWLESERWAPVRTESDALGLVADSLNRGLGRLDEVREQNLEAVRKVASELEVALDDARESAQQAERGFIEATALLTTVRELQRLTAELDRAVSDPGAATPTPTDTQAYRDAARAAIEELVTTSADCVEHLAAGFLRVHEIVDQVHVIGNRSTLIALEATIARPASGAAASRESADDLRRLVLEVQRATESVAGLSSEVELQVAAAVGRMRAARERVAERLEAFPAPAEGGLVKNRVEFDRLLARVREMVQDAAQKGERLSTAGERVSRAAERLVRGLEDENAEVRGVLVRLSPPEPERVPRPTTSAAPAAEASGLRLLGREDLLSRDEPRGHPRSGFGEEKP